MFKILKIIIQAIFFINLIIAEKPLHESNFSEISSIIYEPKVIRKYIKYPDIARNFSISGKSTAFFHINKRGEIKDLIIEESLGSAFDREILDGLTDISTEILQRKNITQEHYYRLSIYFKY